MKGMKKAIIIVLTILFLMLGASALLLSYLLKPNETVEYKTDYGDTFGIWYDGFQVKTLITDYSNISGKDSEFYFVVKGEVNGEDIIGLANDNDLKVYMVKYTIFYDEGNGFEFFSSDTKNEKVIELAKENLPSEKFDKIMNEKNQNNTTVGWF